MAIPISPHTLLRSARTSADLTQAELAARLRTTQSAIARLEAPAANPRIDTLARALRACGHELSLESRPETSSIDETLVAQRLRLAPGERLLAFDRSHADVREIALAGQRARGELG
jgi:transcriptional regulator with XRE-family HTH domain